MPLSDPDSYSISHLMVSSAFWPLPSLLDRYCPLPLPLSLSLSLMPCSAGLPSGSLTSGWLVSGCMTGSLADEGIGETKEVGGDNQRGQQADGMPQGNHLGSDQIIPSPPLLMAPLRD